MNEGINFDAADNSNKALLVYKDSSVEVYKNDDHASNSEAEEKKSESENEATSTKPKTMSLAPANQKETTYFWGPSECAEFIKLLHEHGKRWIVISGVLKNRDQLQCRSHGQKYLKSLRDLA